MLRGRARCGRRLRGGGYARWVPADPPSSPPRLLAWWEGLPLGVQAAVVAPLCVGLLSWLHVAALGQPMGRGIGYGIFWGAIASFAIVASTRMERQKREARRGVDHPDGDPRRRRL